MAAGGTTRERLTAEALSRATLDRQHLLRREAGTALDLVGHLYGLQAQSPSAPYYALWARLADFDPSELSDLIADRQVVRMVLMRGTVHAVTAADALALRPWVQPIMDTDLRTNAAHREALAGLDTAELAAVSRDLLDATPMTMAALRPLLARHWPDRDPAALAHAARCLLPLVQVPPRGLWGRSGQPVCATAENWLGAPAPTRPEPERLLLRYLAAYGPASVADAQAWSGLARLAEVFERLRPRLRVFLDEDGAELFDLPDASRPDPSCAVPVRILAPFDSVLLGHANRTRVISDEHRKVVFTVNGIIKPTILVDGTVAGFVTVTAKKGAGVVEVTTFRRLGKGVESEVASEALRLLRFAHRGADSHDVRFTPMP